MVRLIEFNFTPYCCYKAPGFEFYYGQVCDPNP
jgi:hypothetical protein